MRTESRPSLDLDHRYGPVVPEVAVDPRTIQWFRRESFPQAGPTPWLDRPDALTAIEEKLASGSLTRVEAALARAWVLDGYIVIPRFFTQSRLEAVWAEYEGAVASGAIVEPRNVLVEGDPYPGRVNNAHWHVPGMHAMLHDEDVQRLVRLLLGVEPMPFQTIAFRTGSQQKPHTDTVHMTTYPLGYMLATWTSFEDGDPESGPLFYYPGSHRLPYLTMGDLNVPPERFAESGYQSYQDLYEPAMLAQLEKHDLKPAFFGPRTGDLFLWHANLAHGGAPRRDLTASRKSLVCHYFAEGCLTYHDIAAVPSHALLAEIPPDPELARHLETTQSWFSEAKYETETP